MNLHSPVSPEPEPLRTPTPVGHKITPRDRRFGREADHALAKYWQNGDPVATAFYNCLSLTFPRGEAFSLKA